ncbi:MAG TPA: GNAT family N-acetyltransferase [Xanthobacteraceae bacterium]|nr:GNAT family N-acetyltransferase [Xanthobacteraceae bacterium]
MTAFRASSSDGDVRPADSARAAVSRLADLSRQFIADLDFSIHTSFDTVESEWRDFARHAECTPFQTVEWLTAWHRHVGRRDGVVPVIVVGRFADGATALIAPLAVEPRRRLRRLCWLGQKLSDYNAPLLARDFSQRVTPDRFLAFWRELLKRLQSDAALRFDWIEFEKMPQTIGVQINPFVRLGVIANADSAHITQLAENWEAFYRAKRSSATRRHDRAKRRHMAEFGEIRFVTAAPDDIEQTLDTLWRQQSQIFARKGVHDIFARPGYRELFRDFAANPRTRHLAHVSRVDIGTTCAAVNFAVMFGDCYYHVLSSYCGGQLTRYGPGALHLRELLAYAIKLGLRRFDFMIGDEQYKLEWCDLRLNLFDYSRAATWRGWPVSVLSTARRRVKRFIKQTPRLWRLVRRLRSMVGPLIYRQA